MEVSGLGICRNRDYNVGTIKQFTPDLFKVTYQSSSLISGLEERNTRKNDRSSSVSDRKMVSSLSRSRKIVYEYAICNSWDYFVTLTLSPKQNERFNLDSSYKRLSKWLNHFERRGIHLKYLLIPEPHQDGAWHFHGFICGLPPQELTLFTLDESPVRIRNMILSGRQIYNWPEYSRKFGYVTAEPVLDRKACAAYITKYITKELSQSRIKNNHHLYYCSHGLKKATTIYRGHILHEIENPDFRNEYVSIKNFTNYDDALHCFDD